MKNLLTILLLTLAQVSFAQQIFDKELKLGSGPFAVDIQGTNDGGLLIASTGDSMPSALTRIDSSGGYAYAGVSSDGPLLFYRDAFVGISTSSGGAIDLYKNMQHRSFGTQDSMSIALTLHTNSSVGYALGQNSAGLPPYSSHFGALPFTGPACKVHSAENGSANYQFLTETFVSTTISSCVQSVVPALPQPVLAYTLPICLTGCNILANPSFTHAISADTIFFNNTSTNSVSYLWDFGVLDTSSSQNPYFVVPASGTYNICLTVNDSCGPATICQYITVCTSPTANFSWSQSGSTGNFNATSTSALWYHWDFGDSQTITAQNPSHQYASPGTYNVCLIIGDFCNQDTFCQSVIV